MTRALVIGGAGFLGTAACRELMRRGVETVAAGRSPRPYGTFTSYVALDRDEAAALDRVLNEVEPDVVLDLACYRPHQAAAVVTAFRGARYVFVSSGVYPDLAGRPAREEDFRPLEGEVPVSDLDYMDGKRWCETVLARAAGFPYVAIRPPAVLGGGDPTLRIAAYLQRIEDGGPLLVPEETIDRAASIAWVRDAGHVCAVACDLRRPIDGQAFNVAFEDVSLRDLIEAAAGALGRTPELVPVPFAELPEGASPYGPAPWRHAGLSVERAKAQLGFQPAALEDALAETLAWYRVAKPSHPGYAGRAAELRLARSRLA